MSFITFQCYACGQVLKVGGDKAGRKAKCIKCATVLTIPAQSTESAVNAPPGQPAPAPMPQPTPYPPPQTPYQQPGVYQQPAAYQQPTPYPQPQAYPPQQGQYPPQQGPYGQQPMSPIPGQFPEDPYAGPASGGWDQGYPGPGQPPTWFMTRLGMLLIFIGACVHCGALALYLIGDLLLTIPWIQSLSGRGSTSFSQTWLTLMGIGEIFALLAIITSIVGYVFCMLGPAKGNSFGLCIAAIAVAGLDLLLKLIFQLPVMFTNNLFSLGGTFFSVWFPLLLIQLLYSADFILVPLILREYAEGLKMKRLGKTCFQLIGLAGAYAGERVLYFIFWYVGFGQSQTSPTGGHVLGWITLILLWIGVFLYGAFIIWYTIFVWKVRLRIPER